MDTRNTLAEVESIVTKIIELVIPPSHGFTHIYGTLQTEDALNRTFPTLEKLKECLLYLHTTQQAVKDKDYSKDYNYEEYKKLADNFIAESQQLYTSLVEKIAVLETEYLKQIKAENSIKNFDNPSHAEQLLIQASIADKYSLDAGIYLKDQRMNKEAVQKEAVKQLSSVMWQGFIENTAKKFRYITLPDIYDNGTVAYPCFTMSLSTPLYIVRSEVTYIQEILKNIEEKVTRRTSNKNDGVAIKLCSFMQKNTFPTKEEISLLVQEFEKYELMLLSSMKSSYVTDIQNSEDPKNHLKELLKNREFSKEMDALHKEISEMSSTHRPSLFKPYVQAAVISKLPKENPTTLAYK